MKAYGLFKDKIYPFIENKTATFLWGNGINNYINNSCLDQLPAESRIPAWKDLIKEVATKIGIKIDLDFGEKALSYPELFTLLSEHGANDIHKETAFYLAEKSLKKNEIAKVVADKMVEWHCPIITTNFDLVLENTLGLKSYRNGDGKSDKYPLNYFATFEGEAAKGINPQRSFAIWHCNGAISKPVSMKLDLSDYCLYTARLKEFLPLSSEKYKTKKQFEDSWLSPFYHNTLVIIGLGLPVSEIYLRWLLLERANTKRKDDSLVGEGYYIYAEEDSSITEGFKEYLKYVEIEPIGYPTWKEMYSDIFGI